jgi:hypothetical protein
MSLVTKESILSHIVNPKSTPEKPTSKIKGVDYFTDTNAIGFILNKITGDSTDFKINSPIASTLAKKTADNKYVSNTVDSTKTPTPIEISHNKTAKIQVSNTTSGEREIPGYPLGTYYSQVNTENQLGIRKSTKFGPEHPFVVRNIGDSWDTLGPSDEYDNVGSKLPENKGLRFGSYTRLDKFLMSPAGALFLSNQKAAMKSNAQKFRTDVKYGLTKNLKLVDENPKKYDIKSLLSNTPGNGKIDILAKDPSLTVGFGFAQTIASTISETLLAKATTAADKVTRNLTGIGVDIANQIGDRLLNKVNKITGLVDTANKYKAKVDAFNTVMGIDGTDVSKLKGVILGDNKVFADVGKDLVNLIPYGSDKIKGRSYKDLDFIPFKFYDVNNKKSIVFRALLSGITDTFTPEYASERYIGRPDNVYVYMGTTREISFTFDIYPKSDEELLVLWEKMNYLAGLTYPSWTESGFGGQGMVAPFCKLTLGQMYDNTSGYISGLTYTVMDSSTWETTFAKLPKYIQASVSFVYIGDRLPASDQKHYEGPWIPEVEYQGALTELLGSTFGGILGGDSTAVLEVTGNILDKVGLGN